MTTETDHMRERLAADLRAVIDDTEGLLHATAGLAGEKILAARARAEESLRVAKERMADLGEVGMEKARAAAKVTDTYVHDNPWQAVGIGAGVGFLVGLLLSRK